MRRAAGVLWDTGFLHPDPAKPVDETRLVNPIPNTATTVADRQRLLVDNPATLHGF